MLRKMTVEAGEQRMTHIFPNSMEFGSGAMDADDVGIIMRTQNRPLLLPRALQSVIGQTHRNWHIYLVNDGGDVAPVDELVARLAEQMGDRITVIHNPSIVGRSDAANIGLDRVREAFAIVHDDDDSWDPHYLATTTKFLCAPVNRRYGAVLTKWVWIEESLSGQKIDRLATSVAGYEGEVVDFLEVMRKPIIPPIAMLFRSAVVRAAGGMFNPDLPAVEDWDLNLRSLQLADIAIIPQPLANYHVRRVTDDGTYSNSVTGLLPTHKRTHILYMNSMVRALLQRDPTQIGLAMTLLKESDQARQKVMELQVTAYHELATMQKAMAERLETIEQGLEEIRAMLFDKLRQES